MNNELSKFVTLLQTNRLSLNISKTHFMIFTTNRIPVSRLLIPLCINSENIEEVTHTKFLGVVIDCELNWSHHIRHIKSKISKGIGIVIKAKNVVNRNTLKTLYYSFIYPYINYSNFLAHTTGLFMQQQ